MSEPDDYVSPPMDRVGTVACIDQAELARLRRNSERWERAKCCAVDDGEGMFTICPETAFIDRDYDPDAEAFEAAVDAAIAAEKLDKV